MKHDIMHLHAAARHRHRHRRQGMLTPSFSFATLLLLLSLATVTWISTYSPRSDSGVVFFPTAEAKSATATNTKSVDAYSLLARSIQGRLRTPPDVKDGSEKKSSDCDVFSIASALRTLSASQKALKRIDGAAHEAYQRTHRSSKGSSSSNDNDDEDQTSGSLSVAGRMSRNAARLGCAADAMLAAELCELIDMLPPSDTVNDGAVDTGGKDTGDAGGENAQGVSSATVAAESIDAAAGEAECATSGDGEEVVTHVDGVFGEDGTLSPSSGRIVILNVTIHPPGVGDAISSRRHRRKMKKLESSNIDPSVSVLVVYEAGYRGGAGMDHGGVDDLLVYSRGEDENEEESGKERLPPRGRYLVILSVHNRASSNEEKMASIVSTLDAPPRRLALRSGLVSNEAASVSAPLYRTAGRVVEAIGAVVTAPSAAVLETGGADDDQSVSEDRGDDEGKERGSTDGSDRNGEVKESFTPTRNAIEATVALPPAIHFVGHSLAGGVAALAANILDGSLPMPGGSSKGGKGKEKKGRRCGNKMRNERDEAKDTGDGASSKDESKSQNGGKEATSKPPPSSSTFASPSFNWSGRARGRSSAVCLGPPPCLSANVKAPFVLSVIHGDDIVPRTSRDTLDRLCERTRRTMEGGALQKMARLTGTAWMTDAMSLAASGLKSHAHGSEGEEGKLSAPGRTYLVRPRRYGGKQASASGSGASSMHEVGGSVGGREALRAAVLWQLNDVLLSDSLWAHHSLNAYIRGLDRVRLKGFGNGADDGEDEDVMH